MCQASVVKSQQHVDHIGDASSKARRYSVAYLSCDLDLCAVELESVWKGLKAGRFAVS